MTPIENPALIHSIKEIRKVDSEDREAYYAEHEVNSFLSLGWILLSVPNSECAYFVVGWNRDEEPAKTEREKRIENFSMKS